MAPSSVGKDILSDILQCWTAVCDYQANSINKVCQHRRRVAVETYLTAFCTSVLVCVIFVFVLSKYT